jgi:uncharacterized protein (DUF2384 family)
MAAAAPALRPEEYQKLRSLLESMFEDTPDVGRGDFDTDRWLADWLQRPQPGLAGLTPTEMMQKPGGLTTTRRLLGALASGSFQ